MDFKTRYQKLNNNQKLAVDTVEGPVMVIAGPGTGKTELISMRAANILKQTDTLPENILCLTFTDSGAHAMRERLAQIIGKDAYRVAIHTFHSFGSEVINQNGEFFYHGANFRPADELATFELIQGILDELDYTNPLAGKMNGTYTHLRDIIASISDLKRSGLTGDELLQILNANDEVLDAAESDLAEIFSRRISVSTIAQLVPVALKIAELPLPNLPNGITPLATTLALSLSHAVDEATAENTTKPITTWKNKWLTKNSEGVFVFKDRTRHEKLRAVSFVYFQYLARMQEAELYDYDDMILRVVHALEVFDQLRFNLQEKYQYIMVDEFQDTNLAQMRILANLTNNPAHGDTPNILVVGDDDQAIYSFQGADISNILSFRDNYPKAKLVALVDNYRSGKDILETARTIISQGGDRLERHINELNKTLVAHQPEGAKVSINKASSLSEERSWLVESIKQEIATGQQPSNITVLTRRHSELVELLPYFAQAEIAVSYERRDNVLELPPIALLLQLSRFITLLSQQQLDQADGLLPELLAHPAWSIENQDLWKLSLNAYEKRARWLDTMKTLPAFEALHEWLVELAIQAHIDPLEVMIDKMIGREGRLFDYFFSADKLQANPNLYLRYLEGLRTIRSTLQDHHDNTTSSTLASFVNFVDLYEQAGGTLASVHQPSGLADGVNLMTAHKSKGLEFDSVYIVGAVDSMWGERVRGRSRLIGYPQNLPLNPAGDSPDERLRLFFVAATRAKKRLTISYSTMNDSGKALDPASFLATFASQTIEAKTNLNQQHQAELRWWRHLTEPVDELKSLLSPTLEKYKLSATHLGNFLDVTRGGPPAFLINNLLRFPQAMSPAAAYGSAIHATLQRAHAHLAATGKQRALEDILRDYELELAQHRLSSADFDLYSHKGTEALQAFLDEKYNSFNANQKVELNFAGQQSIIGDVHLTGKLDLAELDKGEKTMTVTDYKTGKPSQRRQGSSDYEKAKLHRYRQQLMFYKLLVENSRDYHNYTVTKGVLQFVEPTKDGQILALDEDFTAVELDEFGRLIAVVWQKITTLDLPETDHYDQTFKGILAFEKDLLDGNI